MGPGVRVTCAVVLWHGHWGHGDTTQMAGRYGMTSEGSRDRPTGGHPAAEGMRPSELPLPRVGRQIAEFIRTQVGGGVLLLAAAVAALVWANSPWVDSYEELWETNISVGFGDAYTISGDLRHWVNEGLMSIFFFVIGLEIKRELVTGELAHWRKAALPAVAAVGGMVTPAVVYTAVNAGGAGARGWGIPMATDIAFVLGVLALLGPRIPSGLRLFMLSLAVIDDIGGIAVIAVVYAGDITMSSLGLAGLLLGAVIAVRWLGVRSIPIYLLLGAGLWLVLFESGVHATLAGVALGLVVPARPRLDRNHLEVEPEPLLERPTAESLWAAWAQARNLVSVSERLEFVLHPWSSYLIVPLFALANAGVRLDASTMADAAGSRIALGIVLGLVIGKLVGVSLFTWAAVRLGLGSLPEGVSWSHLIGGAALAGIGFTVSLLIAGLAFAEPQLASEAKIGILTGSLTAAIVGWSVLHLAGRGQPLDLGSPESAGHRNDAQPTA
jgi:Na+:H+ antiporter, NhaA family